MGRRGREQLHEPIDGDTTARLAPTRDGKRHDRCKGADRYRAKRPLRVASMTWSCSAALTANRGRMAARKPRASAGSMTVVSTISRTCAVQTKDGRPQKSKQKAKRKGK